MKKVKLGSLPDNASFRRSVTSQVVYEVDRKEKGKVIYTSLKSERTFYGDKNMIVYVTK